MKPEEIKGLWLGLLGVVIFALTLPMTRLAVGTADAPQMSGAFIAVGRAVVAGAAYMVWLAWKLARTDRLAQVDQSKLDVSFLQGVGMQFLNIKAWMLALTLTAGWVVNAAGQPSTNPGQRLAIICGVMLLFAFCSNFSYALLGSLLRDWLAQGQRLRWFNRALALVLAATAAWMVTA